MRWVLDWGNCHLARWNVQLRPGRCAVVVAAVMLLAGAPLARAAGPKWFAPVAIDPLSATNGGNQVFASVSCPSVSFCAAVDSEGRVFTYNGTAWSAPWLVDRAPPVFADELVLSCKSSAFCVLVDGGSDHAYTYDGRTWSSGSRIDQPGNLVTSLSCASSSFCVAVDGEGNAITYNGHAWSIPSQIDSGPDGLWSVSCPSSSFCAAGDWSGDALTYSAGKWSGPGLIDSNSVIVSMSCSSSSACVAIGGGVDAMVWNGLSWTSPDEIMTVGGLDSVSCASGLFCVAVGDIASNLDGAAFMFNGNWSGPVTLAPGAPASSVSCASSTFCEAVDGRGNVITYATQRPTPIRRTQTHIYHAFTASGKRTIRVTKTVRGWCEVASWAIRRDDAFDCKSGHRVYDPCFSSKKAKGIVLCPPSPWKAVGVEIRLTRRLPLRYPGKPSTSVNPWAIETQSGARCLAAPFESKVLDGLYADYRCSKTDYLWGGPARLTPHWWIVTAPISTKTLAREAFVNAAWF